MPNDSGRTVAGKAKRARSSDDAMSRLRVAELLLDVSNKVAADLTLDDQTRFAGVAEHHREQAFALVFLRLDHAEAAVLGQHRQAAVGAR